MISTLLQSCQQQQHDGDTSGKNIIGRGRGILEIERTHAKLDQQTEARKKGQYAREDLIAMESADNEDYMNCRHADSVNDQWHQIAGNDDMITVMAGAKYHNKA